MKFMKGENVQKQTVAGGISTKRQHSNESRMKTEDQPPQKKSKFAEGFVEHFKNVVWKVSNHRLPGSV